MLLYFSTSPFNCLILGSPEVPQRKSHSRDCHFSSLSLAVKVQVSPEFQDALVCVPLGFSHLPRFYKTPNIGIGLVVPLMSLYLWGFPSIAKKASKRLETEKEGLSLNETDFQTLPTHTIFFFFKHWITLGASALSYLSGKKISLGDQGASITAVLAKTH